MKSLSIFTMLTALLLSGFLTAQTTTETEERNERIRQRWNRSLVGDSTYTFKKEANNLLVQTSESVKPGKALCVAMGQGRNALYLAEEGWDVSGFDLADKAVAHAVEQANKKGLNLTTYIASYETFDYGAEKWDLITWLYGACLETDQIAEKIKKSLKPGGLFVFEFFHRDAGIAMGRPDFGCEKNALKEKFKKVGGFEILLYEEKEGVADYSLKPYKLIYMVLSKK